MPINKDMTRPMESAAGARNSGEGAPNGMNPVAAMYRVEEAAELVHEYDLDSYEELGPDRAEEYEDAWEDFQYWVRKMADLFGRQIPGQDDSFEMEVQAGTDEDGEPVYETVTVQNPHGAIQSGNDQVKLPDPPGKGGNE